MLRAVLFDMDGVLVDTEPEYKKLDRMLAAELGISLTPEEQSRYAGINTLETWRDLQKRYRFSQDPLVLARRVETMMAEYYQNGDLRSYPETVALLKSCAGSGLKVAVATSTVLPQAESVVRRLGLSGAVHAIASGCMTERSKPAPDIFLLAMRMLGVDGSDALVIEDADSGVTAARAAGVRRVIGIRHPDGGQSLSGADVVVDTLAGITVQSLHDMME